MRPDTFNAATWFVDRNVHEGRGSKVAIECGDERVTYQQVLDRVNRVGNALREGLDVRLEERVMLLLVDTPEFIYSFFGAMKIGAVPIPTSTLWKSADYEYVLNDSRASVVIASEALLPHIQAIPRARLGNGMYFPLGVGAPSILWPGAPFAPNVYTVIEKHRPPLFYSVPTNYGMLLPHRRDGADFDLSSIRYGVSAGEALPSALFERFKQRFGVEILDGIGSTEILHIFISNRPGAIRPGSSGQIVPGYEARILDEENRPVSPGDIGNLRIAGDSTCACYWNKHEKTKETIEGTWSRA